MIKLLKQSMELLKKSCEMSENRIDSQIMGISTLILVDILSDAWAEVTINLAEMANLLFTKESFSFQFSIQTLYLDFYRSLNALQNIKKESTSDWLDFREGLDKLYIQYSAIKNSELKEKLNTGDLSETFASLLTKKFIEPYFALNFNADTSRIEKRINEIAALNQPEKLEFLKHIKKVISKSEYKKKIESSQLLQALISAFPDRSHLVINETFNKIKDKENAVELLSAFDELSLPSPEKLTDDIMLSCLRLQGNRIYWGEAKEDDRNTYIADHLEAVGYRVKDQTRWSVSNAGKSSGEIDIFISDKKKHPLSIIEALNLNYFNTSYIEMHIDKIFNYDANGLERNFILLYSNANSFSNLCDKYIKLISKREYLYELIDFEMIENELSTANLKVGKSKHKREKNEVFLYHLMLNLAMS